MKSLISTIIIALLATGQTTLAETDAERRAEALKIIAELEARMEQRRVVMVDKGPKWTRYMFDGKELVIDGKHQKGYRYEFDMSDQTTIDRIVESVRTIRRYGKSCNVVSGFTYERLPVGVGRTSPKTRTLCDTGCFQLREWEKTEYGRRKRFIDVQERCTF